MSSMEPEQLEDLQELQRQLNSIDDPKNVEKTDHFFEAVKHVEEVSSGQGSG